MEWIPERYHGFYWDYRSHKDIEPNEENLITVLDPEDSFSYMPSPQMVQNKHTWYIAISAMNYYYFIYYISCRFRNICWIYHMNHLRMQMMGTCIPNVRLLNLSEPLKINSTVFH